MEMNPRFSVRQLRWIPVVTDHGRAVLTLDEVLIQAHLIRSFNVRDPLVHAALNRFLISVAVLVIREAALTTTTSLDDMATNGFEAQHVRAALDRVDSRLWLIHETTPFMQTPVLAELAAAEGKDEQLDCPAELWPRTPGRNGRAWFDSYGGTFNDATLNPEAAALALITHWFYSTKSNKKTVKTVSVIGEDGTSQDVPMSWISLGSAGLAGHPNARANNTTFWHSGAQLAYFLMLNVAPHWLTEPTLPSWALPYSPSSPTDSLAGHTYSGNAVILYFNEATQRFDGAIRGGHPYGDDPASAKKWGSDQLAATAFEDPSRAWRDAVSKAPGESKGTPIKLLFEGFNPTHTTSQNLRQWFLDGSRPSLRHGAVRSRTRSLDVLSIGTKVTAGTPQIEYVGLMSIDSNQLDPSAAAAELIADLADTSARKPEAAIKAAVTLAFPRNGQHANPLCIPTTQHAIRTFHRLLDPAFDKAVQAIVAGGEPDGIIEQVADAKLRAYDLATAPFLSAGALPHIARGRARLDIGTRRDFTVDPKLDPVSRFVGRFIRQSRTDTGFRVALSRGLSATTQASTDVHLTSPLAELGSSERVGVTRAIGLLASHHRLTHAPNTSLPSALAALTRATGARFDGVSGISARVGLLPNLDVEQATVALDSLVGRLSVERIGVSFYDVVQRLRRWDVGSADERTAHRNGFIFNYYSNEKPIRQATK